MTALTHTPDIIKWFDKLPKYAREHIRDIERERDVAIRALNECLDNQTESPIFITDLICTGEEQGPTFKTRYIQGHRITIRHAGIEADIVLRPQDVADSNKGAIDIQYQSMSHKESAVLAPVSRNKIHLYSLTIKS